MDIAKLLNPAAVRSVGALNSKKRLFLMLGDIAGSAYRISAEDTAEALMERESLGPTAVGNGVALPHARLPGLTAVCGAFVRVETPVDFDAADRQPVDLIFALFAPVNAGAEHLKALALVSRTLRDPKICAKLRANSDPATLHAILVSGPASKAA